MKLLNLIKNYLTYLILIKMKSFLRWWFFFKFENLIYPIRKFNQIGFLSTLRKSLKTFEAYLNDFYLIKIRAKSKTAISNYCFIISIVFLFMDTVRSFIFSIILRFFLFIRLMLQFFIEIFMFGFIYTFKKSFWQQKFKSLFIFLLIMPFFILGILKIPFKLTILFFISYFIITFPKIFNKQTFLNIVEGASSWKYEIILFVENLSIFFSSKLHKFTISVFNNESFFDQKYKTYIYEYWFKFYPIEQQFLKTEFSIARKKLRKYLNLK